MARAAWAAGINVMHQAQGEGRARAKLFLGMDTQLMCAAPMFVVATGRAERVLAPIPEAGGLEREEGAGDSISAWSQCGQRILRAADGLTPIAASAGRCLRPVHPYDISSG